MINWANLKKACLLSMLIQEKLAINIPGIGLHISTQLVYGNLSISSLMIRSKSTMFGLEQEQFQRIKP